MLVDAAGGGEEVVLVDGFKASLQHYSAIAAGCF